jgi:uncharacterized membrane protein
MKDGLMVLGAILGIVLISLVIAFGVDSGMKRTEREYAQRCAEVAKIAKASEHWSGARQCIVLVEGNLREVKL